jgi:hypothetical protein
MTGRQADVTLNNLFRLLRTGTVLTFLIVAKKVRLYCLPLQMRCGGWCQPIYSLDVIIARLHTSLLCTYARPFFLCIFNHAEVLALSISLLLLPSTNDLLPRGRYNAFPHPYRSLCSFIRHCCVQ